MAGGSGQEAVGKGQLARGSWQGAVGKGQLALVGRENGEYFQKSVTKLIIKKLITLTNGKEKKRKATSFGRFDTR